MFLNFLINKFTRVYKKNTGLHPCLQRYHRDAIRYYEHRRCDMFVGRGVNHGIL